jgi:hypothetical protein
MGFGDLLLLLWMWGVCIHIWRLTNLNFIPLLQLEHTSLAHYPKPEQIVYQAATDLSLLFLVVFICFNKIARGAFSQAGNVAFAHWLPVVLMAYYIYRCAFPLADRQKWWFMLYRCIFAPGFAIIFRDGFVGDLLTSLVRVFVPLALSFAYVYGCVANYFHPSAQVDGQSRRLSTTDNISPTIFWEERFVFNSVILPFLTLFPLWIRLVQCLRRAVETQARWPHYGNAAKYTSAIAVISLATFNPQIRTQSAWVAGFVFATLFQFVWDICMDWGILVWGSSIEADGNYICVCGLFGLRRTRLLGTKNKSSNTYIYIMIACINLILRFAWTLTLLPTNASYLQAHTGIVSFLLEHLGPLIAAAEVFRRMMWAILRVEWEHIEVYGGSDPKSAGSGRSISPVSSTSSFTKVSVAYTDTGKTLTVVYADVC